MKRVDKLLDKDGGTLIADQLGSLSRSIKAQKAVVVSANDGERKALLVY